MGAEEGTGRCDRFIFFDYQPGGAGVERNGFTGPVQLRKKR